MLGSHGKATLETPSEASVARCGTRVARVAREDTTLGTQPYACTAVLQ